MTSLAKKSSAASVESPPASSVKLSPTLPVKTSPPSSMKTPPPSSVEVSSVKVSSMKSPPSSPMKPPPSPSVKSPPSPSPSPPQNMQQIRRAKITDITGVHSLLSHYSARGILLPRSESDLYQNMREFTVITSGEEIIACVALQIFTADLGEVRSLAVSPKHSGRGFGRVLVEAVERDAIAIGLRRLMALTYADDFFHHLGFNTVPMHTLPEKVWGACINCPKFRNCDEIAVLKKL